MLLVGLTPLVMDVLSGPLSDRADVSAVPFPGDSFEQMADEFGAELVVIDVTYLDEALVRPLLMQRFAESQPVLAFVSERGPAWFDDLRHDVSGHLEVADAEHLIGPDRPPQPAPGLVPSTSDAKAATRPRRSPAIGLPVVWLALRIRSKASASADPVALHQQALGPLDHLAGSSASRRSAASPRSSASSRLCARAAAIAGSRSLSRNGLTR